MSPLRLVTAETSTDAQAAMIAEVSHGASDSALGTRLDDRGKSLSNSEGRQTRRHSFEEIIRVDI